MDPPIPRASHIHLVGPVLIPLRSCILWDLGTRFGHAQGNGPWVTSRHFAKFERFLLRPLMRSIPKHLLLRGVNMETENELPKVGYKSCVVSVDPDTLPVGAAPSRGFVFVAENTAQFEAEMCRTFDKDVGTSFKIFTPNNSCISVASLVGLLQGGTAGSDTLQALNVEQNGTILFSIAFQPDVLQSRQLELGDTDSESNGDDSADNRTRNASKGYTAILNECLSMYIPRGEDCTLLAKKDRRFKEEAGCIGSEFGPPCLLPGMSGLVLILFCVFFFSGVGRNQGLHNMQCIWLHLLKFTLTMLCKRGIWSPLFTI
jgi:hypothetical protein